MKYVHFTLLPEKLPKSGPQARKTGAKISVFPVFILGGVRWIRNPLATPGSACLPLTRRIFSLACSLTKKKPAGPLASMLADWFFSRLYLFKSAWSQKRPACFLHPSGETHHRTQPFLLVRSADPADRSINFGKKEALDSDQRYLTFDTLADVLTMIVGKLFFCHCTSHRHSIQTTYGCCHVLISELSQAWPS